MSQQFIFSRKLLKEQIARITEELCDLKKRVRAIETESRKPAERPVSVEPTLFGSVIVRNPLPHIAPGMILAYACITAKSRHYRIYINQRDAAHFSSCKFARFDINRKSFVFTNQKGEGTSLAHYVGGMILIESRKIVEQIFYLYGVKIPERGRAAHTIRVTVGPDFGKPDAMPVMRLS